jgi:hypothetical protein
MQPEGISDLQAGLSSPPAMSALKHLQAETATDLDALLPSILDKSFKRGVVGDDVRSL